MGTYTTNYNLFMPTVGEQGWGELVNGNFATIDTNMVGLDGRIGTLETETDAMKETLDKINFESDGTLITDSIKVKKLYVIPELSTKYGDVVYATNTQPSINAQKTSGGTYTTETITVNGYVVKSGITFPLKISTGMYIENSSDLVIPIITGLTATFSWDSYTNYNSATATVYKNGVSVCSGSADFTKTFTVNEGDKIYIQYRVGSYLPNADYRAVLSLNITPAPDLRIW